MKRILLGDDREPLLATLEAILRHWGYRVSAASNIKNLNGFLCTSELNLLIFSASLLRNNKSLVTALEACVARSGASLLVIADHDSPCALNVPCERITPPLDIFSLFAAIQRHLEDEPRQNLRLALELPGLLQIGESSRFVDILSLSTHGMFIKTSIQPEVGTILKIVAPLVGMKRELELSARVIYQVVPNLDNNFQGGVGLEFLEPRSSDLNDLQQFLQHRFHEDFQSARARFALGTNCDTLIADDEEMVLRLVTYARTEKS